MSRQHLVSWPGLRIRHMRNGRRKGLRNCKALSRATESVRPRGVAEPLEGRRLLAIIAWDGGGDGVNWSNPLNWSVDVLPGAEDDVTISAAGDPTILITTGTQSIKSFLTEEAISVEGGIPQVATTAEIHANLQLAGGTVRGGTLHLLGGSALVASTNVNSRLSGPMTVSGDILVNGTSSTRLTIDGGLTLGGTLRGVWWLDEGFDDARVSGCVVRDLAMMNPAARPGQPGPL